MVRDSLFTRFLPAAGASAVLALVAATRPLGMIPRAIAVACVVAAWVTAVVLRRNVVRAHASVILALASVIAAGQVDAGPAYGVAGALFLVGCLVSMRAARTRRAVRAAAEHGRLPIRSAAVLLVTASIVTAGLVAGLPWLAERIERRINAMFGGGDAEEATAFSTRMVLGSTRGMLLSDTVVMRIEGERPEYLRGAVYDHYDPPFWVTTVEGRKGHAAPAPPASDAGTTRMTLVRGAPNGEDMRWFLPGNACDLRVPSGAIEIDAFGVVRRGRGDDPATLTYRTRDCAVPQAHVAPPSPADLDVPPRVRRALEAIAEGWTAGANTDREKLQAIEQELSRFEYSLAVPRDVGIDPIVDFVSVHRAGHCEMFASAMALMARMSGIPARVVGGYRVTEVNPITGLAVVRDRNAHAWVEAWVDGAWRGWDPTPASETFAPRPGAVDHVRDALALGFEAVVSLLARLGLLGIAAVLVAIVAVLSALRWVAARLRVRRLRGARRAALPLPCFEALTDALARAGHTREPSEPIELFARRLEQDTAAWAREASQALLDYARFRYGEIGEESDVARAVERAARAVSTATPP